MNIEDAYKVIGISSSSTDDELKIKYKELAVKYHPDKYSDDPNKFKHINEAYQFIQDYKENPHKHRQAGQGPFGRSDNHPFHNAGFGGMGGNWEEIFSNFNQDHSHSRSRSYDVSPISVDVDISFKDSVVGADKELKFKKNAKCNSCDGKGSETIPNGCKNCNGFGKIVSQSQGMMFTQSCNKCYGRNIKFKNCDTCKAKGVVEVDTNLTVHIPPGNHSVLRLRGAGNYAGTSILGDAYTDVHVNVHAEKDPELTLDGPHVLYNLKLSLLDAITGCEREVKTIYSNRIISIPAMSKNKEEIHLAGCGIKQQNGIQKVILDVEYPTDTKKLVKALKNG